MKVCACIPTRGDVDITPVVHSLPLTWDVVVYDNSKQETDLSVFGRYAAILKTDAELIFTQDDDCFVSHPGLLEETYLEECGGEWPFPLIANMPHEFRPHYSDSVLLGFGSIFHRDAPGRAFGRFYGSGIPEIIELMESDDGRALLRRTADVIFTVLHPDRILVDIPKENRSFATDDNRMYRQPEFVGERARILRLAREARDRS